MAAAVDDLADAAVDVAVLASRGLGGSGGGGGIGGAEEVHIEGDGGGWGPSEAQGDAADVVASGGWGLGAGQRRGGGGWALLGGIDGAPAWLRRRLSAAAAAAGPTTRRTSVSAADGVAAGVGGGGLPAAEAGERRRSLGMFAWGGRRGRDARKEGVVAEPPNFPGGASSSFRLTPSMAAGGTGASAGVLGRGEARHGGGIVAGGGGGGGGLALRRPARLSFWEVDSDGARCVRALTRAQIIDEVRRSARGGGGTGRGVVVDRNVLQLRDIRQVDPAFVAKAALWVRRDALVVSLEGVRAIILHDRLFLFDTEGASMGPAFNVIVERLGSIGGGLGLEETFLPFEFRALEGILIYACVALETEFVAIEPALTRSLETLAVALTVERLEELRGLEQRLNSFYGRARKVQHVLQDVLDEDEDMANMYLSEARKHPDLRRNPLDHEEAEQLLETYMQMVDDLTNRAALLNQAIDDTENIIEIHLDIKQNKLLLTSLMLSMASTVLGFGSLVTAVFGMNLQLPTAAAALPSSSTYFWAVVGSLLAAMTVGMSLLLWWSKSLGLFPRQRVLKTPWHGRAEPSWDPLAPPLPPSVVNGK